MFFIYVPICFSQSVIYSKCFLLEGDSFALGFACASFSFPLFPTGVMDVFFKSILLEKFSIKTFL